MRKTIIPLYFRPGDEHALLLEPESGAILLTDENLHTDAGTEGHDLWDELSDLAKPAFYIFDSEMEARAAATFYTGVAVTCKTGQTPDGEGILMVSDAHGDPFEELNLRVTDHRSPKVRHTAEAYGSWDLSTSECEAWMDPNRQIDRSDIEMAIASKLSGLPVDVLNGVQIAMESIPGAYVGFVNLSVHDIVDDSRCENVDETDLPDADIQSALKAAAKKHDSLDLPYCLDAVFDQLRDAKPDLFKDGGPDYG